MEDTFDENEMTEESFIDYECRVSEERAMAGWLGRKNPAGDLDPTNDWC